MPTLEAQSAGGKAAAKIFRKIAEDKYYENPTRCKSCSDVIELVSGVKIPKTRKRKFCDKCWGSGRKQKETQKTCPVCGKLISVNSKTCLEHMHRKPSEIGSRTKGELFAVRKNWQSARSTIRRHAQSVFKPSECSSCGYDKHVEICHKKPVASFDDSATIDEINSPENLIGLCPNCHWEFDNIVG